MKKQLFWMIGMIIAALIVAAAWLRGTRSGPAVGEFDAQASDVRPNPVLAQSVSDQSYSAKPASGCTVFTMSKGDRVFFGGNDDWSEPDSYYWVDPGDAKNYGAIWIGRPDNVQQGVNEKGLAYDANGLPRVDTNPHPEREPVSGGYTSYPIHILHECASVEEVIEWVNTHQWHSYMHGQMQFADASGDAVIISAGVDAEGLHCEPENAR